MAVCDQPRCSREATTSVLLTGDRYVSIGVCDDHLPGYVEFFTILGVEVR
jgi:hypothetical protein